MRRRNRYECEEREEVEEGKIEKPAQIGKMRIPRTNKWPGVKFASFLNVCVCIHNLKYINLLVKLN